MKLIRTKDCESFREQMLIKSTYVISLKSNNQSIFKENNTLHIVCKNNKGQISKIKLKKK